MAQSKAQRRVMRNPARCRGRHEINVVPMIDMMIILVFFLIFTAVFTKTNILSSTCRAPTGAEPTCPRALNLEVIIRKDKIEIADRGTGLLQDRPDQRGGCDLVGLQDYLKLVKTKYPDEDRRDHPARAGYCL